MCSLPRSAGRPAYGVWGRCRTPDSPPGFGVIYMEQTPHAVSTVFPGMGQHSEELRLPRNVPQGARCRSASKSQGIAISSLGFRV